MTTKEAIKLLTQMYVEYQKHFVIDDKYLEAFTTLIMQALSDKKDSTH